MMKQFSSGGDVHLHESCLIYNSSRLIIVGLLIMTYVIAHCCL